MAFDSLLIAEDCGEIADAILRRIRFNSLTNPFHRTRDDIVVAKHNGVIAHECNIAGVLFDGIATARLNRREHASNTGFAHADFVGDLCRAITIADATISCKRIAEGGDIGWIDLDIVDLNRTARCTDFGRRSCDVAMQRFAKLIRQFDGIFDDLRLFLDRFQRSFATRCRGDDAFDSFDFDGAKVLLHHRFDALERFDAVRLLDGLAQLRFDRSQFFRFRLSLLGEDLTRRAESTLVCFGQLAFDLCNRSRLRRIRRCADLFAFRRFGFWDDENALFVGEFVVSERNDGICGRLCEFVEFIANRLENRRRADDRHRIGCHHLIRFGESANRRSKRRQFCGIERFDFGERRFEFRHFARHRANRRLNSVDEFLGDFGGGDEVFRIGGEGDIELAGCHFFEARRYCRSRIFGKALCSNGFGDIADDVLRHDTGFAERRCTFDDIAQQYAIDVIGDTAHAFEAVGCPLPTHRCGCFATREDVLRNGVVKRLEFATEGGKRARERRGDLFGGIHTRELDGAFGVELRAF